MDALKIGVQPYAFVIRDVIRHEQTGLLVDPKRGVIYGTGGAPVGSVCGDGYVRLGSRRGHPCIYAHRLVWETVNGPIPPGLQIDHLNGCKADNRVSNLEVVTQSENVLRAIAMGLMPRGEDKVQAKLTDEAVRQIRNTVGQVATRKWARILGVDPAVVRAVRQGRTWRHVPMRSWARPTTKRTTRRSRGRR